MTAIGHLSRVVLDAADAPRLAAFYAGLTGWAPEPPGSGGEQLVLRSPAGPALAFQAAPDHVPPQWPGQEHPQQVHLDLDVDDLAAAAAGAQALGATELAAGPYWRTFADPAGHPVDLCLETARPPMSRLWISIDTPSPSALAAFYAALLGLPVTHDTETGAAIGAGGPVTIFLQPVEGYRAPRWPDPAAPQQAHLDVEVQDLVTARDRVRQMGATPLHEDADHVVFADPAGHPFCLRSPR